MPTAGRVIYDGAVCHIMQRGNNRQRIFKSDEDHEKILNLIKEYKARYDFAVYNYCLMSNHLHFLIKVSKGRDLPKIMQGVLQSFRFYYKRKYKYSGYLFQGRYKSKTIENDAYLLECARYIERNPLRAGIAKDLLKYKWTSYVFYAFGYKNDIISENPMFLAMDDKATRRQESYRQYVLEDRPYEDIIDKEFNIT